MLTREHPGMSPNSHFDQKKADFTCNFIECLKLGDDFYGQRFKLLPWQRDVVQEFYGTIKQNGFRQYHFLYLELPKKQGKTQIGAGLALYHTFADGVRDGEIYVVAADKENASICFNAALSMLKQCPFLLKRAKVKTSQKTIIDTKTNNVFKVLSSESHSKHGYKPSCVIFDELHAQPTRELWDVMTYGSGDARKQPVFIVLTTAGSDPDRKSIGWEVHEKARKIKEAREGNTDYNDNPLWLPVLYGLGGDDSIIRNIDIYDEKVWYQCNPSLGHTISIDTLRDEANDARTSEAEERKFRWLRLNQWISTKAVGWLPLTMWDDTEKPIPENLEGKMCWGGLDLSSTSDLTAFVLTFPPQEGLDFWYQLFFPFIPYDRISEKEKMDGVPYRKWYEDGYIFASDGLSINYDDIFDKIIELAKIYDIKFIGSDPWRAKDLIQRLIDNNIKCCEIPQGVRDLSEPMKEWEKMIMDKVIFHEYNPVARWCFGNVKLFIDSNRNQKPDKIKSRGRIDVIAAALNSVATHRLTPISNLDVFYVPDF